MKKENPMTRSSEIAAAVANLNLDAAADREAQSVQTLSEQIDAERLFRAQASARQQAMKDEIRALGEQMADSRKRENKLRQRKRVFANAAHQLRMIDEE
jgi:hypothetical protein